MVVSADALSGRFSVTFLIPKRNREGMGYDAAFPVLPPNQCTC